MADLSSGRPRSPIAAALQLAVLLLIALAMLVPLFWLVSTSLKGPAEDIFTTPPFTADTIATLPPEASTAGLGITMDLSSSHRLRADQSTWKGL